MVVPGCPIAICLSGKGKKMEMVKGVRCHFGGGQDKSGWSHHFTWLFLKKKKITQDNLFRIRCNSPIKLLYRTQVSGVLGCVRDRRGLLWFLRFLSTTSHDCSTRLSIYPRSRLLTALLTRGAQSALCVPIHPDPISNTIHFKVQAEITQNEGRRVDVHPFFK
jgi:hypothetical protein